MPFNQDENWVIITGAGSGIGFSTAIHLQDNNFKVLALVRQEKDIIKFDSFKNILSTKTDVTSDSDILMLIEFVQNHNITPKILINNAGILDIGLLSTTSTSIFEKMFDVNVLGVHRLTQALLPDIIKNKGKIIIIGSDSGLVNFKMTSLYCMTKHALEPYADGLYDELKNLGVGVTILEPGNHFTPIVEKTYKGWELPENTIHPSFVKTLKKLKESTEDAITSFEKSRKPIIIAKKIEEIIKDDKAKKRYLITSKQESKRVIRVNFDKMARLNKYNKFRFSDDEMHDFLDFSLNLD